MKRYPPPIDMVALIVAAVIFCLLIGWLVSGLN